MLAIGCNDRKIYLLDTTSGQNAVAPLEGHTNTAINVRFNHAGDLLVSDDWSHILRFWDPRTGQPLLELPAVTGCLRFSHDDRLLAAFVRGDKIGVLRAATAPVTSKILAPQTSKNRYHWLHVHPNGRLLAALSDRGLAFIDLSANCEIELIAGEHIYPLGFEQDGSLSTYGALGLVHWPIGIDGNDSERFRIGPPKILDKLARSDVWGKSLDGRVVAVPQFNGALVLHLDGSGRRLRLQPQEDVRQCSVSPDGRLVATGTHGTLGREGAKLWDAHTGKLVKTFDVGGFCRPQFSPDGNWLTLLSVGDGVLQIWQVGSWQPGPRFHIHTAAHIHRDGVAFSPDSRLLALTSIDGSVLLGALRTGKVIARLWLPEGHIQTPEKFTPDGTKLIVIADDALSGL